MNLIKGQFYRIKDEVEFKVTENPLEYYGTEVYNGETYHNFYEAQWKLFHWIDPNQVEPMKLEPVEAYRKD